MRVFDVAAAAFGIMVLSPLLVFLAIMIRLTSTGPVYYRPTRVGKDGKPFQFLKFRSMVTGGANSGPKVTVSGDHRITPIGRVLRRTKLDELPELFSVLKGDMSLVGPRPEDPRYVALYTPSQRQILRVRPGITSAASLAYRHEEEMLKGGDWEKVYRDEVLPSKLAIDLEYFAHRTLVSDLKLIFRTISSMAK